MWHFSEEEKANKPEKDTAASKPAPVKKPSTSGEDNSPPERLPINVNERQDLNEIRKIAQRLMKRY